MSIVLTSVLALVPQGEHFDQTLATVNEGIYLTEGHLQNIEDALTASESVNDMVTERDGQITTLQGEIADLESAAATKDARIAELEQEVATLGKEPSGTGSTARAPAADPSPEDTKKPSFLSDDTPINKWIDKELKHRERFK
jgi:hypothetical protein